MSRILLLIVLLAASFGAAMILMQNDMDSRQTRTAQTNKSSLKALKDMQKQKFTDAQVETFRNECVSEASKNDDVKRMGMDVSGFCGCMANAHMKLDLSIQGEKEKRQEFYSKGKPCFEKYLKPVVINMCAQTNATTGVKFDCKCMYAYSVKEHVTLWIEGAEGNTNILSPQEQDRRKKALGLDMMKKCIK
ncbi:MAG: hypothetical protein H6858_04350 [Rhodospirillales bacterium]|nr:hypothetical protein [Rhodospirillales bacterium]